MTNPKTSGLFFHLLLGKYSNDISIEACSRVFPVGFCQRMETSANAVELFLQIL